MLRTAPDVMDRSGREKVAGLPRTCERSATAPATVCLGPQQPVSASRRPQRCIFIMSGCVSGGDLRRMQSDRSLLCCYICVGLCSRVLGVRSLLFVVCRCSSLFVVVRRCTSLFVDVRRCSSLFVTVRCCSLLFVVVRRCSSLFVVVRRCSSLFVVVRRCSSLFVVVRGRRRRFRCHRHKSFEAKRQLDVASSRAPSPHSRRALTIFQ